MILIDTNFVSELMRSAPAIAVLDWFSVHEASELFLSTISEAELRAGAAILSEGKRRDSLTRVIDAVIRDDFAGRLLSFDSSAAKAYAGIAAARRAAGWPISEADCQIATIARAHGAALATRNIQDFEGCGVELLDPWRR